MKCQYINPTPVQCFNCQYSDCIRDEGQDNRDKYNRYRSENSEKERERDRNRYPDEKEIRIKRNSEWQKNHRTQRNAYMRERYWKQKAEKDKVK
ncbi:hypothetical protein [Anaerocolumna chitinilytica]|uniref:Uncharacterized protein n=1 Tax=Anaerocolumna chitinilytica TaxID=1727145 RepID=A0A7M3SAK9_9FIRM|nr:hypothetical protein [Anaerocolumna chitinilytica]BCK01627.1 hypothetical protein bsdcttw_46670 [Anaerocolumna chitinilytica]